MSPVYLLCFLFIGNTMARSSKDLIQPKEDVGPKVEKEIQEVVQDLKLVEKLESQLANNSSREARMLLKKLSFLAGIKAGGLIHSSGTIATSNSLRIFGKVMNSALSVSYGTVEDMQASAAPAMTQNDEANQMKTMNPLQTIRENFIKSHNQLVNRVNTRFLKAGLNEVPTLRSH